MVRIARIAEVRAVATEEAVTGSQTLPRNPGGRSEPLDGIRGLAVIGVLLTHAAHYFALPIWAISPIIFGWGMLICSSLFPGS